MGHELAPTVRVRVGLGRLGGLAGNMVSERSPVDSGRPEEALVGKCSAVQDGMSAMVVILSVYMSIVCRVVCNSRVDDHDL